jgi:hypothetical protein
MGHSRPYITQVLKEEFKNPAKATAIRKATLEILKERPGSASRIFDKLPSLLPRETMQRLSLKCLNILSSMDANSITYDSNGIHLHNKKDQENIFLFIKEIVSFSISEILDKKGHIKIELIKLLEWDSFKDQLGPSELTISILCGYVGAINQEIAANYSKEISELHLKYAGFSGYLNESIQHNGNYETNIRRWIIDSLNEEKKLMICSTQKNNLNIELYPILRWPNENLNTGSLMVLTAMNTASSMKFFKKNPDKKNCLQLETIKRNDLT